MHLSKVNEALEHRITGGTEFQWSCWPNARYIDYGSEHGSASVVFNIDTQEVYSAEVNDTANQHKPYRWVNPIYKQWYLDEAKERNVDPNQAWDNVNWYDLETSEDWLEKARAIIRGESFDERIQVPITLEKDELLKLMTLAHERDITLNKMVESILQEMIDRHNNE